MKELQYEKSPGKISLTGRMERSATPAMPVGAGCALPLAWVKALGHRLQRWRQLLHDGVDDVSTQLRALISE